MDSSGTLGYTRETEREKKTFNTQIELKLENLKSVGRKILKQKIKFFSLTSNLRHCGFF